MGLLGKVAMGMVFVLPISDTTEAEEQQRRRHRETYGVGVLGNCCTHGVALCSAFIKHPRTRVVAAFEKNPRRAEELAEVLGRPLEKSYDAVIGHTEVDFVVVTCDPCEKAALVEKAARSGKHVFLNKPGCDNLDNAHKIAAAVEQYPIYLVYDIPMVRFIPVYARLLEEVRAGVHGKIFGYHHLFGMNFDPSFDLATRWPERLDPPERSGGGEMTNMGCYAIDFAVSLFGRPKAVTAKWRKEWKVYREADVEHFGQILLDYGDFFALLEVGKQQLEGERRHSNSMTINFEHKTFFIDASAQLVAVNHVPLDFAEFAEGSRVVGSIEQMLRALDKGVPPSSAADNLVLATETLMAAYLSIVEDRTVALPLQSGRNPLQPRFRR